LGSLWLGFQMAPRAKAEKFKMRQYPNGFG
jgi:hypothetical protein